MPKDSNELNSSPSAPLPEGVAGRKVIAFATDDSSLTSLRMGLLALGDSVDVRRGGLAQAVRYFERESETQAAIVDISGLADVHAALDDLARVCPSYVKVLTIGDNADIHFYRHLVNELGVTEYLPKPLTRDVVQRIMLPLLSGTAADPTGSRGGHVVAVCGARGGVGATTLAVSMALELTAVTKGHVALLDLHLRDGAAALMLSGRPGAGLKIALEDPGRADALFLDRVAIPIEERLRLIAAEEAFASTPQVTEAGVSRVLELLRRRFNYIVVDLPIPPLPGMQPVLNLARHVIVVLEPDVAALRNARAIRSTVVDSTGTDRVLLVLNNADKKGGLPRPMIAKALGREPDIIIPDLGRKMLEALNLGVPAIRSVPGLRTAIAPMIREIAGTPGQTPKSKLARMFSR